MQVEEFLEASVARLPNKVAPIAGDRRIPTANSMNRQMHWPIH